MGQFYDSCPQNLQEWIQEQHVFWVATAPLSPEGHVNVSPKGAFDCFHVIGPDKVWYEDLTGSGSETIAHLRENKRITIMFTAFEGPPRIVRLFGTGTAYEFGTPEYEELIPKEKRKPGSRAAIVMDIHKVGSSCGYSVPFYDFNGERTLLLERMSQREARVDLEAPNTREDKSLREYWAKNNARSIDGLPGVMCAQDAETIPSNLWNREDDIARSDTKVATRQNDRKRGILMEVRSNDLVSKGMGSMLVAAFTVGALSALLCVRVARLFS